MRVFLLDVEAALASASRLNHIDQGREGAGRDLDDLVFVTPQQARDTRGIDLRLRHEVLGIDEDAEGILWVATEGGGVARLTSTRPPTERGREKRMLFHPMGRWRTSSQKRVPPPPSRMEVMPPAAVTRFHRNAARTAGVMAAPYMV